MDDLISRQDAIKAIDEKAKRIKNEDTLNGLAGAVGILFDLPPVKPQEKTGHWTLYHEGCFDESYVCSKCDGDSPFDYTYCPYCGAKMVDEQERSEE